MTAEVSQSQPPGQFYCPNCERMYKVGDHCPEDGTRLVRIKAVVDPLLGRNLDNRYTIIEKLGQGGMGAVYRASQHSVGREVAIKVVSQHLISNPDVIKRFLREAKLASRLAHPNAVAVMDFGQSDDGLFYLVMELVTGRTLDQVIKAEGIMRPERLVRIGMQVCDALEGAHALQIVHRDLKPANIMLLTQGRDLVKVLDFGLAKSIEPDQAATTMTNAGALLGTPAFMPPELALGLSCDGRADLYALGCILYLLGSGRLPFVSESSHELIAMHGAERAPPVTGVPAPLAKVIDRLLEKDPMHRYQTATATREALEAAQEQGRASTPLPFAMDTSPSLGPFPATPDQFAHLNTPTPRRRTPAEIERIASSDTLAANAITASPTIIEQRKRRWVIPFLALCVLAGGGAAAYFALAGEDAPAAATSAPESTETPPTTPPVETKPAEAKTVEAAPPVETKPAEPTETAPVETSTVTSTETRPAASTTKPTTRPIRPKPKPTVTTTKPKPTPTTTTTQPPPATTTKTKPTMPF